MRRPAVVLVLVLAAAVLAARVSATAGPRAAPTATGSAGCGYERWPVKTLADPTRRTVRLARPVSTTVLKLRSLPARPGTQTRRAAGVERTVYHLRAILVAAALEDDDDIHLELRDPRQAAATMIAEIPDFHCTVGARPALRAEMQRARATFVARCGAPGATFAVYRPGDVVSLTGVGFFDRPHGQRGVAPNAIELHPVLQLAVRRCS
jgi:hypothetical protein